MNAKLSLLLAVVLLALTGPTAARADGGTRGLGLRLAPQVGQLTVNGYYDTARHETNRTTEAIVRGKSQAIAYGATLKLGFEQLWKTAAPKTRRRSLLGLGLSYARSARDSFDFSTELEDYRFETRFDYLSVAGVFEGSFANDVLVLEGALGYGVAWANLEGVLVAQNNITSDYLLSVGVHARVVRTNSAALTAGFGCELTGFSPFRSEPGIADVSLCSARLGGSLLLRKK